MPHSLHWKPDWPQARQRLARWWRGESLALNITALRSRPVEPPAPPPEPPDDEARWLNLAYRCALNESELARRRYLAEAFPVFEAMLGPGSLGLLLGAQPRFAPETVWYQPCIDDPERYEPIRFNNVLTFQRSNVKGVSCSRLIFLTELPWLPARRASWAG